MVHIGSASAGPIARRGLFSPQRWRGRDDRHACWTSWRSGRRAKGAIRVQPVRPAGAPRDGPVAGARLAARSAGHASGWGRRRWRRSWRWSVFPRASSSAARCSWSSRSAAAQVGGGSTSWSGIPPGPIALENKPWARFSDGQLARYTKALSGSARGLRVVALLGAGWSDGELQALRRRKQRTACVLGSDVRQWVATCAAGASEPASRPS
jgi:hypothetical protein